MLKIDFKNAFNSIRQDVVMESVREYFPEIFPFVGFWDFVIQSSEGVQQGDPIGSLCFCLAIHKLMGLLKSR